MRKEDKSWVSVGDLRAALLEHLAPEQSAAAEEFPGCVFVLCVSRFLNDVIVSDVDIIVLLMVSMLLVIMLFCGVYMVYTCHRRYENGLVVIMLLCVVYMVYTCHRRYENRFFSRTDWQEGGASAAAAAPASAATSVQADLSEDCGSGALVVY